jgi:hypothetical protein
MLGWTPLFDLTVSDRFVEGGHGDEKLRFDFVQGVCWLLDRSEFLPNLHTGKGFSLTIVYF